MSNTCPTCKQPASGHFCANCGSSLEGSVACTECGNELPAGGRFCNQCGAPTAAARVLLAERAAASGAGSQAVPWAIGGAVVLALLGVIVFQRSQSGAAAPAPTPAAPFAAAGGAAGAVGDPSQIDLSSMTPRQAADRLFDRVMRLAESGDSAQARTFLPMALGAYQQVPDLDSDARYHVGVLSLLGRDPRTARAQADTILAANPDHLFGLYVAASAERELGNQAQARQLFQHLLDAYDRESAKGLPEYQEHAPVLPVMKQDASRAVDSL